MLDTATVGPCWCGPSYFNDGTPTLVSSAGNKVVFRAAIEAVAHAGAARRFAGSQDRPRPWLLDQRVLQRHERHDHLGGDPPDRAEGPGRVALCVRRWRAGHAADLAVHQGAAGTWASYAHDPNMVPVVANGRVYVANDSGLEVFGLAPAGD